MFFLTPLFFFPILVFLLLSTWMAPEQESPEVIQENVTYSANLVRSPLFSINVIEMPTQPPEEELAYTSSLARAPGFPIVIQQPLELPDREIIEDSSALVAITESNTAEKTNALYEEGLAHYHAKEWDQAIQIFTQVIDLQPDNSDAKLYLAYAYLLKYQSRETLKKSELLFQEVLKKVPTYTDAAEGLKRTKELIEVFDKAGEPPAPPPPPVVPEVPKASKIQKQPLAETLLDAAKEFNKDGNNWAAVELYLRLLNLSQSEAEKTCEITLKSLTTHEGLPSHCCQHLPNTEYLFLLGRAYAALGYHTTAMAVYENALKVKLDNSDVLIALGNEYLFFGDFQAARCLFARAANISPQDPAGWVGLARSETQLGELEDAESHYAAAPADSDVWAAYAGFLIGERRYADGEYAYRYLEYLKNDDETWRSALFENTAYTRPTVYARAGVAEEKEKDLFSHLWVASLKYWNIEAGVFYPINDNFRISARIREGETKQSLLVSKLTQFNYISRGGGIRGEWFYNPYWTIVADAGMEWIYNRECGNLLPTERGVKFEPTVIFRYVKTPHTIVFGETTDTIPFRDFTKQHLRVITREAAILAYQHDCGDNRLFQVDGAWLWYQDPISNQEQDVNAWVQTGIPYIEDLLTARYHCEYRRFNHEVSGYYSFQYQLTQWLKLHCTKKWLFGGHLDLEYWHGWRITRGSNPQQQIIVVPTTLGPVVTVLNQIDQVYLTLGYTPRDYIDCSVGASYYHDSFDYTIVAAKISVDCRF
ncbi:MAG: tetratricopeptide repeat protein [Parachlamydiaceae bacterium]